MLAMSILIMHRILYHIRRRNESTNCWKEKNIYCKSKVESG